MQRNAVLKAYLKKGVGPLVVADSGGAAPVLNTLLSWSLTSADCSRPDVVNGHGAGPVAIGEGVQLWSDRTYFLSNVPAELAGGLLYQFPHRIYDDFTVSVNAVPARVYILYEDGRNDDLIQLLGNEGWTLVSPAGFVWSGSAMSYGVKLVSSPTSFWFPSTSSERLMGVVIVSEAATTVQVQHNPCCLARALAPRSPILCLCLFCVRLCVAA